VVLFPGFFATHQLCRCFVVLSLLSGRNPEYLIEQQINPFLFKKFYFGNYSTGYILIDGGSNSSVFKTSKTIPISQETSHWQQTQPLQECTKAKN